MLQGFCRPICDPALQDRLTELEAQLSTKGCGICLSVTFVCTILAKSVHGRLRPWWWWWGYDDRLKSYR